MATDAELTNFGFTLPAGNDLISGGDDAITNNVRKTWDKIMEESPRRGIIPDGANVGAYIGYQYGGNWYVTGSTQNLLDMPAGSEGSGTLSVITGVEGGFSHTTQIWSRGGGTPGIWWRTLRTSGEMNQWERLDLEAGTEQVLYRGFIPDGANLDELYGYTYRGHWYVKNTAHAETFLGTIPAKIGAGTFQIISGEASYNHTVHIYSVHGSNGALWFRMSTGPMVFGEWIDLLSAGGGASELSWGHYGTPNSQLISDFEARHPQVSTGNKGAIAFRWDHGLTNLKSTIFPMLDARGWKSIVAMNSRNWEKPENSGMSQTELAARISDGSTEVGNHTADGNATGAHKDMDTKEQLWDGIVVGKRELEAQLGHTIDHFIVPGTVNGMGGFLQGASMDVYSSTYAGSLILAHHAVASGGFGQIYRVLDGRTKQAQRHWTMESATLSSIKSRIDTAASTKTGLQLMMHPRYLDLPGYLSTADLTEIFDYIQSKVTAGELVVLGTSELVRAKL